ncbi:MAG: MOSC domain-containing protein [Caulobacteraceae bacterium]
MSGRVISVARDPGHHFSKQNQLSIRLIAGIGVAGDAHAGATVKHRSRVAVDPTQPNLRQVHLIQAELHDELAARGFSVGPGDMGENITTRGLDLLALPRGAKLHLGAEAVVEVTGLRNPCIQIDRFQDGLLEAVIVRDPRRGLIRKAGVMSIVLAGGDVAPDDPITVELPSGPRLPLERV